MQFADKHSQNAQMGADKLAQLFSKEEDRILDDNYKSSDNFCNDIMSTIFNDLEAKLIETGENSEASFDDHFKKKMEKYEVDAKGPAKASVLIKVLSIKMPTLLRKYSQKVKYEAK
jgi:uncharacterized membrane protein YheB (UPF0754 family)